MHSLLHPQFEMDTLFTNSLDNRGFLAQPVIDVEQFADELPRVTTLARAAQKIGELIAPTQLRYLRGSLDAPLLDVPPEAFKSIIPRNVSERLYITRPYKTQGTQQVVRIARGQSNLRLPGMAHPNTGLVFHDTDYRKIARSAVGLAINAGAGASINNPVEQNSSNRAEHDRKVGSAHAKSAASMIKSGDKLDFDVQHTRMVFEQVFRGMRVRPPILYKPHNALSLLLKADTELRRIVETSGYNNPLNFQRTMYAPLDPALRSKNQRALTVNLYQRDETAHIWRAYMRLGGFYCNAQRVKLSEARNAAEIVYLQNRQNIKPAELSIYDTKVHGLQPLLEMAQP